MNFDKVKEYINRIPEKIKEIFKLKDQKGNRTLQEELNKIDKELSIIYFDIMKANEISIYKKELINQKVALLNLKFEELMPELQNIDDNGISEELIKKETQKDRLIMIFVLFLMLIFPLIGFLAFTGYSIYSLVHLTKLLMDYKNNSNKITNSQDKIRSMEITLHNCGVFLNKKHNIWLENQNKNNEEVMRNLEITIANNLLQEHLNTGYFRPIPKNVEEYLIEMLQEDLQTDEKELSKLMELAREKTNLENLSKEMELDISLVRTNKKSQK